MSNSTADRLQLDLRQLPDGVVPTLKEQAKRNGFTLTALCRSILIRHALKEGETEYGPPAKPVVIPERPPWSV